MCDADVAAISLVTNKSRNEVSSTLIPYVARALSNQCVEYQRLPITEEYIDWVVNDSDQLTVALDETDNACIIMVASRGVENELAAARLANIAAELCRDYDVHTLFWKDSDTPIDARDFLLGDIKEVEQTHEVEEAPTTLIERAVKPRRVLATSGATARPRAFGMFNAEPEAALGMMRAELTRVDPQDLEFMELEARRAKSAPMRLAAWALSISTAIIAAPLAIPLVVHNLVRGEDVRAGAMAYAVAGLFAIMAQTGYAPDLGGLL